MFPPSAFIKFETNMKTKYIIFFALLMTYKGLLTLSQTINPSNNPTRTVSCGKGWYPFGNLCYRIGGKRQIGRLSWNEASKSCIEYGGQLAVVNTKEIQDFLVSFLLMDISETVWVGLYIPEGNGTLRWVDGSPLQYAVWDKGEPTGVAFGNKEDCVTIVFNNVGENWKTGKWNDNSCDKHKHYICQRGKRIQIGRVSDPRQCSGGGWRLHRFCYFPVLDSALPWDEADEFCKSHYDGNLVTIVDYRTSVFLEYLMRNYTENAFWIGIKIKEGNHQQWSSGWQVAYTDWLESNEERPVGACATLTPNNSWSVQPCSSNFPFICESSRVEPPTLPATPEGYKCPELLDKSLAPIWIDIGGNKCYSFHVKTKKTWTDAHFFCTRMGGSIITFHSEKEVIMMEQFVRYSQYSMHIGLYRSLLNDEEFTWADGSPFDFAYWDDNEPNLLKEQCAEMKLYNMRWNDIECHTNQGFICSIQKVNDTKTTETEPCFQGYSMHVLVSVIFCVISLSVLVGIVTYFFRLCERDPKKTTTEDTYAEIIIRDDT